MFVPTESGVQVRLTGYSPRSVTLAVGGDLTEETVEDFRAQVSQLASTDRDLVLDLTELNFITSQGVSALCWLQRRTAAGDHTITAHGARGLPREVLDVVGMSKILAMVD